MTSIRVPLPSLLAALPSTPLWLGPVLAPRLLALSHSLGGSPGCSLSPFLIVVGSTGQGRLEGPVLVVASRLSGIRRLAVPSDEDSWLVIIDVAECSSPYVRRWEGHIRRTHPQEEAVVDAALRRSRGSVAFFVNAAPLRSRGRIVITAKGSAVHRTSLEPAIPIDAMIFSSY